MNPSNKTFNLKKEIIDPDKFVYRFEINLTTDKYHDTYLFEGSEDSVREQFDMLIEQEKERFKNKIRFRNELVSITKSN